MDQHPTPPPPPRTTSNPAAATALAPFAAYSSSATRSSVRGPPSSAMLRGMTSSPAHSSHRRSSPSSLYPPPLSGRRASASGSGSGSSSGSPSSRLRHQIPPSPRPARGGRQRSTHTPPSSSPVFSELASIRTVGAARATSQQRSEMRAAGTLYGGRPLHQALPSWSAMYARSRLGAPPPRPSRSFSGVAAPPASRQLQQPPPPSTGTLTPQPSRYFSFPGFGTSASQQAQPSPSVVQPPAGGILSGGTGIPSPAMPQQQAKSSFTDLAPLPGGSGGIFSGLAPPASQQPDATSLYSDLAATQPACHGGHTQQPTWPTMSRVSAPPTTGGFSGTPLPASQQRQPSSSGVPLQPGGTFSRYPSSAIMGQQPEATSSFTDLAPLTSGGRILPDLSTGSGNFSDLPSGSGGIAPAASQQQQTKSSFTTLAPLPSGMSFSRLRPGHGETAMFGSSSWPPSVPLGAPAASDTMTMYGHGGQPPSDSELPPLPPTLQIRPDEVMQFSQPAVNDDITFSESEAVRMQRPPVLQVKKEPVDIDDTMCLHEPQLITVDDDNDDDDGEISALLNTFRSPNEPGRLGLVEHTSTEDMLIQHGGCVGSSSAVEGSGQSWKAMLTPSDMVTTGAGIPWNSSDGSTTSMSFQQQQIPQHLQGDMLFSTGVSDVIAPQYCQCQPSENNIFLSGFGQQQFQSLNLQMPTTMLSATELLQLVSGPGCPHIWNTTADGSGQGAAAEMFGQMSVGGGMTMSTGQGWPETAVAAANQYGMFDNSGTAWAVAVAVPADGMASEFDQMNIGDDQGSLGIGQGWPATPPAPTFDINGSSSGAWASMPWNSSSWTMENYSTTPGPELGLGATMEQPRLTTPRPPSGASRSTSMPQRGSANGEFFSVAEIEIILKDKRLKEMVNTDPNRVKRILNNRTSVSKLRPQRRAE